MVREADLEHLLELALKALGIAQGQVNCRLAGPSEVRRLNRRFAGVDQGTDVLAFPATADTGARFVVPEELRGDLGDIVISVADARNQAELSWSDELRLLAVHGLLHLLGHDHHGAAEARRMTSSTRRLLSLDAERRGAKAPLAPDLAPAAPS